MPSQMQLQANPKNIQTCFKNCFYEVPVFQRPYSWEVDQLEDYWNDVASTRSDFFFGTTVTWISQRRELANDTYSLIDGQQRITTSTIALSAIRDFFKKYSEIDPNDPLYDAEFVRSAADQQSVTHKYLVVTDDDSQEHPVLRRQEPMFWETIQQPNAIPSNANYDGISRLIAKAREYFERKIAESVDSFDGLEPIVEKLKEIRGNILSARIIQVELTTEEDAFMIFETLNTRGAELELADLIKNLIIRELAQNDQHNQSALAARWQRMVNHVTQGGHNAELMNRFIWQSWNSRYSAVKEPDLFKQLKIEIGNDQSQQMAYLEGLEEDSQIYLFLQERQGGQPFPGTKTRTRNAIEVAEVQDAIRALSLFNVSVANSAILALARKYHTDSTILTQSSLKKAMRAIENFHFQFTAMAKSGSTGGTRSRYNAFAVQLENAQSKQEANLAIQGLITKLERSLPRPDQVRGSFESMFYAHGRQLTTAERARVNGPLIRYILLKFAKNSGAVPPGTDPAGWTIEHIVPQSTGHREHGHYTKLIGNLTLLTAQANNDAGNGDFNAKREDLLTHARPLDTILQKWLRDSNMIMPTAEDVTERGQELSRLAVEEVWSVQY